ncbi:hypothetical protein BZG35_17205 [Brevundimonas sp. LM2]|uniref:GcrA family cell cycle regulator n=1 Tax=Brevundimonas sp. LM2 TaxID=1938605 RepID=UPI000983E184|nr:GcrA family cell cycle regulator [Brevundimonas sp. LM2]AQR63191.1 hypothetical protein BZG35_17205 [Brevundimonas sp. LM2]
MKASAWTDDRVGRLKTLWLAGQSADAIARHLAHGITRNAVLGKVRRLGLSTGRQAGVASLAKVQPAPAPRLRLPASGAPVTASASSPEPGPATLQSVGRADCRWPLGDPRALDFAVCGRRVARGAYCADHAAIAYRPRRETPADLDRLAQLG